MARARPAGYLAVMDLLALGARIRSRRDRRGLKQADVAAALRLSPQAVSKWERGENAPDISLLVPLAHLLDVSVEWLLGGAPFERETFTAVVLVTGVEGYAARAERDGPRALAAWINGVHGTVTEAVRHEGGVPVKYTGDGFLAFFTGAEAAARALRAARAARAQVDHPGLVVALDAGEIYLGTIGHPDYAALDILGAPVNTAFTLLARVAERCPDGIGATARVTEGVDAHGVVVLDA
ncbi:MAG: helix-turn-helix domain-containing protein [Myxococcales bacterium]|nr:helix-turn-helix domain-containing protein [Myxococcales bacterium]